MRRFGWLALAGFVATIPIANWMVQRYGVVPVGFGLMAPAAVYVVGVAFTLRDLAHRALGRWWVLGGIVAGGLLSLLVAPGFAVASATAFLLSETADLLVYEPLERRSWPLAVGLSNTVGLVVDSVVFLALAFGSLEFLPGQIVGKALMTVLALLVLVPARAVLARHA
jgi:uncharacterized PurR-regulated membrane protein YhhQ (DUF165 family)